ncbi:hypothetical protein BHM03_00007344 [Ensete ventricosum]|nr:hypothetical protein BHM03_00007344 [Ensete ventricosum]
MRTRSNREGAQLAEKTRMRDRLRNPDGPPFIFPTEDGIKKGSEGCQLSTLPRSEQLCVLFEKVIAAAVDEFRLLRGVHGELQNLVTTLSTIQALLEDAEERQLQDKLVRYWLAKLKDVAYDMDELLDKCAAAKIRWEMEMEMESRAQRCRSVVASPILVGTGGKYSDQDEHRANEKLVVSFNPVKLELAGTVK